MPAERPAGSKRRFVAVLAGLLVVAAIARVVLITQMGSHYYFADTAEYEAAARSILAGHGPGHDFPRAPLYPALMALGFALFGEGNYVGVRMLQLLAGLTVVALCMRLGYRLGGRSGAVLAGAGAAIAPTLVFTTAMLYPTALYTFLLLGVTLLAHSLDARPGPWRGALLGLLMFLLWMTDQVATAPLAAVLLWLLWGTWTTSFVPAQRRRRAGTVAIAVATTALLAAPWTIIQERLNSHPAFFMEKAQTVLYFARTDPNVGGQRALHDTATVFRPLTTIEFVGREFRLLREQPVPYVSDYVREFVHYFQPTPDRIQTQNVYTSRGAKLVTALYFLPVLICGIVGLLFGGGRARDRWLLALVPIGTAALYALFFTQTRYRIPTEPQMLVLASLGLVRLFPRLNATIAGREEVEDGQTARGPSEDPGRGR